MGKLQKLVGYKVVDKATAIIIAIVPTVNFNRYPEKEYTHFPIWEDE